MTRRRANAEARETTRFRAQRIAKLLHLGWIKSAEEIPEEAIPIDPDRISLGWDRPTCFRDEPFTCVDCAKEEVWKATDQQWYFETTGAPFYQTAVRCRACRAKERERKREARRSAGHDPG